MKAFVTFLIFVFGVCIWPFLIFEVMLLLRAAPVPYFVAGPVMIFVFMVGLFGFAMGLFAPCWRYDL